jgi:hypothetical protein
MLLGFMALSVQGLSQISMKKLALVAIILLAGCSTTNTSTGDSDPRLAQLEEKSRIIAEREKQCIDKTLTRSHDEMASIAATPDASVELRMEKINNERDRELSACRATADNENAEISRQESNEYELQAQQERDRASLMAILTTSRMH